MATGYLARRRGFVDASRARPLMVAIQKLVTPAVLFLSFWGLRPGSAALVLALPLAGAFSIAAQTGAAYFCARMLRLEGPARGSFLVAALLSNVGYLGWTINLSLFGQKGFDYAFMYGFYFNFAVYLVAYPIAAKYGAGTDLKELPFRKRLLVEGIFVRGLAAIVAGVLLNVAGVPRPAAFGRLNSAAVVVATVLLMFAAGLDVRLRSLKNHARPAALMCGIKMALSPLAAAALIAAASAFVRIDPMPARVLLIESATPLAISCLSIASIFRLDRDLMNTMWLYSTALFFVVFQGFFLAFR